MRIGLANKGIGSLDANDKSQSAQLHYVHTSSSLSTPVLFCCFHRILCLCDWQQVECAERAKLAGVAVSILSLIGSECKLEALSVVAEQVSTFLLFDVHPYFLIFIKYICSLLVSLNESMRLICCEVFFVCFFIMKKNPLFRRLWSNVE